MQNKNMHIKYMQYNQVLFVDKSLLPTRKAITKYVATALMIPVTNYNIYI